MQLQSQIMRDNTRILTDVQDVTSDASIHMPAATSTPKYKHARQDAVRDASLRQTHVHGASLHSAPQPKSTPYSRQSKPDQTKMDSRRHVLGVPSDVEEEDE